MDQAVIRSLGKWPAVPAVYGWLALDQRGNWLLRDPANGDFGTIGNAALREFIGRNYEPDAGGRWFFQNGPQRVYVRLACTPLVYRLDGRALADHRGRPSGMLTGAWLDECGALVIAAAAGVGVLDDRDLLAASDLIDDAWQWFACGARRAPLGRIFRAELPQRFGFVTDPRPEIDGTSDAA